MDPLSFEVGARSGAARAGLLRTPHGTLRTPVFFPVGTYGAVRGLTPDDLAGIGVQGVLANTYHLHLRPGEDLVAEHGGLHGFMGWPGPILTDSGGFQIHSLDHLCRRSEKGVTFRDPRTGDRHHLTPESCIHIQQKLGADLIVVLDEFEPVGRESGDVPQREFSASEQRPATRSRKTPFEERPQTPSAERERMERTLRWAARCRAAHARADQMLFGIVQGGGSPELRAESAARTAALGFGAFAIGGLGLGEDSDLRLALAAAAIAPLPVTAPRYLMGLGLPEDLVGAVARGVDLFDCVIPTRHGRHGSVFTARGPLNLRNARFREDRAPIEASCTCPACARYSRAYLRHLLTSGEALGQRLASAHNLAFYMRLMRDIREAIERDAFEAWTKDWRATYRPEAGP